MYTICLTEVGGGQYLTILFKNGYLTASCLLSHQGRGVRYLIHLILCKYIMTQVYAKTCTTLDACHRERGSVPPNSKTYMAAATGAGAASTGKSDARTDRPFMAGRPQFKPGQTDPLWQDDNPISQDRPTIYGRTTTPYTFPVIKVASYGECL